MTLCKMFTNSVSIIKKRCQNHLHKTNPHLKAIYGQDGGLQVTLKLELATIS